MGMSTWQGTPTSGTLSVYPDERYEDGNGNATVGRLDYVLDVASRTWRDAHNPLADAYLVVAAPGEPYPATAMFEETFRYAGRPQVPQHFRRDLVASDLLATEYSYIQPQKVRAYNGAEPITMQAAREFLGFKPELDEAIGMFGEVLANLDHGTVVQEARITQAITRSDSAAATVTGLAGIAPDDILAAADPLPSRPVGTHIAQFSVSGLLQRLKKTAAAWVAVASPLMTLLGSQIRQGVNPIDFGAVGDDVHDDTPAFLAAAATGYIMNITDAPVAWKLTAVVQVTNSVIGIGNRPRIKRYGSIGRYNVDAVFLVRNYQGRGLVFRNITIDGGLPPGDNFPVSPPYTDANGHAEYGHNISIEGSKNVTIEDCTLTNAPGDNVFIGQCNVGLPNGIPRWCTNIRVRNNDLMRPRRCNVAVVSAKRVWITDNYVQKTGSYVAGIDIEPDNDSSLRVEDVVVSGNHADMPQATFVNLYNPNAGVPIRRVTVENNPYIDAEIGVKATTGRSDVIKVLGNEYVGVNGVANYFLLINNACDLLIVKGNRDFGGKTSGWSITKQDGFIFEGNQWVNPTRLVALSLDRCKNGQVIGNYVKLAPSTFGNIGLTGVGEDRTRNVQFTGNQVVGADYIFRVTGPPVHDILVDGNSFDATGRVFSLDGSAYGSSVNITPNNTLTGGAQMAVGVFDRQYTPTNRTTAALKSYSATLPTTGYYATDHEIVKIGATVGNVRGWQTVSGGWAANTAWAAATAYALGAEVYAGTQVYRATTAGTSGGTAPAHTTGSAADGGVTWLYLGALAIFGAKGTLAPLVAPVVPPPPATPAPPVITRVNGPGTLALAPVVGTNQPVVTKDADPYRPSYRLRYIWTPTTTGAGTPEDPKVVTAKTLTRLLVTGPVGYELISPDVTAIETTGAMLDGVITEGAPRDIVAVENVGSNFYLYLMNLAGYTTPVEITVWGTYKRLP